MLSPIDEATHLDYVQRVADGGLPRLGQRLLLSTDWIVQCVGSALPGVPSPVCHQASKAAITAAYDDSYQYEAQQPPLYYAVTAGLRWPFRHVLGLSVLTGTRLTGALWLAAGLMLMWFAGCVLGLDWWVVAPAVLLVGASPGAIYYDSIVNNDAAGIFAGGLAAALGAVAWRHRQCVPTWCLWLAGLCIPLLKDSDALAVVVVSVMLLLAAWVEADVASRKPARLRLQSALRSWLPVGGAFLLGSAIAVAAWSVVFQELSLINPKTLPTFQIFYGPRAGVSELAGNALQMLYPLTGSFEPYQSSNAHVQPGTAFSNNLASINATAISFLLIAAGMAFLFVKERRWPHWLGVVSLLVLFFGGWALGISILVTYGYDTPLMPRYGIGVAVLLCLALVGAFEGPWPTRLLWLFSSVTFALSFVYMLV